MAKSKSKLELEDALASTLAESINKQFKGQALKTAFFLDGDDDAPQSIYVHSTYRHWRRCFNNVFLHTVLYRTSVFVWNSHS